MKVTYTVHDVAQVNVAAKATLGNGNVIDVQVPAMVAQLIDPATDTITTLRETDQTKFEEFQSKFVEGATVTGTFEAEE